MSTYTFQQDINELKEQVDALKRIDQLSVRVTKTGDEYLAVSTPDGSGGNLEQKMLSTTFFSNSANYIPVSRNMTLSDANAQRIVSADDVVLTIPNDLGWSLGATCYIVQNANNFSFVYNDVTIVAPLGFQDAIGTVYQVKKIGYESSKDVYSVIQLGISVAGLEIPHLEYDNTDKTVWNNGKGDIDSNTSFGVHALKSINTPTAGLNAAFGVYALGSSLTGSSNTALGFYSMSESLTANHCVGVGLYSLNDAQLGDFNIGIGVASRGGGVGGSHNISIGTGAGANNDYYDDTQTGEQSNNSIHIGHEAVSDGATTNVIVIGNEAIGEGSNTTVIGNDETIQTHLRGELLLDKGITFDLLPSLGFSLKNRIAFLADGVLSLIRPYLNGVLDIDFSGVTGVKKLTAPNKSGTIATIDDVKLKEVKVSLTAQQIREMFSNEVIIVPAHGEGKYTEIISIKFNYMFGTVVFNHPQDYIRVYQGAAGSYYTHISYGFLDGAVSGIFTALPRDIGRIEPNSPVKMYINTTDATNGDGTMDVYVTYIVRDL